MALTALQDDAGRLHRGRPQPRQILQESVLVQGQLGVHLLGGEDFLADPDEPHDVAGQALGQRDKMFRWPLRERKLPRQGQQLGCWLG